MRMQFPPPDAPVDPDWFAPLEDLIEVVPTERPYRFFDPADFMMMGRVVRRGRPAITIYKHNYTRSHINLDPHGTAYRYVPPPIDGPGLGRYLRHRSVLDALCALNLHELPWMKPGLEHEQLGPSPWDEAEVVDLCGLDRLAMHEAEDADDPEDGDSHGHLHLV